jgi:predicted signal transduction protein with EAL and GGDEF domain
MEELQGCANFLSLLNRSHRDTQKVGEKYVNRDDFKKLNVTLGHEDGEHLLVDA